ncbi:MAG TPA: DUF4397 domain-containing protein [Gemmatimonadaceae bacterium]|nr:DUF4397 domain-containing protein [Gemmatimonadaceae bacterium]
MMTRIQRGAAAIFVAAVVSGCADAGPAPSGTAELKVVHAAPLVGAIDVRVGEMPAVTGLPYGRTSALVSVPSGAQVITIRSNGSQIMQFNATLTAAQRSALTLGTDTAQVSAVTPDTGVAVSNRANLRLINVVGSSAAEPTLLHMRLRFPDVADSTAVIGLDTRVASHGPLMYFNPGHFSVQFVPAGGSTVLAQTEFDVAAGEKKAIVLERAANGAYSVRIVVEP